MQPLCIREKRCTAPAVSGPVGRTTIAAYPLLHDDQGIPREGGGGGQNGSLGSSAWPTHPAPHMRKDFLRRKNENYQRGLKLEVNFRNTNCFLGPLTPPSTPPPWIGEFATKPWPDEDPTTRRTELAT